METQTERVVQVDEGVSEPAAVEVLPACETTGDSGQVRETLSEDVADIEPSEVPSDVPGKPQAPKGYEGVAPELWPDKDGNPPKMTESLMRQLRGKYFTVKHPTLENCGHKYDAVNEPRHRHCENCWFQWFNTHPQLVETADQFYRTQGKGPMIGMRGVHFVKMFTRYMATVIHLMNEEKRLEPSNQERTDAGSIDSTAARENESGQVASEVADVIQNGKTGSDQGDNEVAQQ